MRHVRSWSEIVGMHGTEQIRGAIQKKRENLHNTTPGVPIGMKLETQIFDAFLFLNVISI